MCVALSFWSLQIELLVATGLIMAEKQQLSAMCMCVCVSDIPSNSSSARLVHGH